MDDDESAVTCVGCGRAPGVDDVTGPTGVPWTWTTESAEAETADAGAIQAEDSGTAEGAAFRLLCAHCTREHSRSIEAKLSRAWW